MTKRRYLVQNTKTGAKRTILVPSGTDPKTLIKPDEKVISAVGKVESDEA